MVFNTTFNNISVISWWSVLLVEETGVPRENHRPAAIVMDYHGKYIVMMRRTELVIFYLKFIQIYLTIYLQYYLEHQWHYGLPMNHEVTYWHRTPAGYGLSWKLMSIMINQDNNLRVLGLWCLTPLSTIFSYKSWQPVLSVEETGVHGENHQSATSHRQTLSHNVVSNGVRTHNFSGDRH